MTDPIHPVDAFLQVCPEVDPDRLNEVRSYLDRMVDVDLAEVELRFAALGATMSQASEAFITFGELGASLTEISKGLNK